MSYLTMRQHLLNAFAQNNFEQVFSSGENLKQSHNRRNPYINSLHYQYPNNHGLNLVVSFPGYKTYRNSQGSLVYDYRVELNNIPISHVNIIADLYNKATKSNTAAEMLSNFLRAIAASGDDLDINNYTQLNTLNLSPPGYELLQYVGSIHQHLKKTYLYNGNLDWNYSIEELSTLIPLIVLQEDINYPMPRFQGRRMSFYRYLEALYCAQQGAVHNLEEVVTRALSHNRPALWNDCINYEDITNLVYL